MKTLVKPSLVLLMFVAICLLPTQMLAQLNADASPKFSINIEIKGSDTTLSCNQGCTWKKITLRDQSTTVDENGIVNPNDASGDKGFSFNAQKNTRGISIKSLKGTQWKEPIEITCQSSCKLVLNEFGLAQ
tara:strand:+ start:1267 stop:1659 length:393 start_codon:yes stop_codon:yes gene_type:complete